MTKGALSAKLTERLLRLERAIVPMNIAAGLDQQEAERRSIHLMMVMTMRVHKRNLPRLNPVNVLWAYVQIARKAQAAGMVVAADTITGLAEFHWQRLGPTVIPEWHPLAKWIESCRGDILVTEEFN